MEFVEAVRGRRSIRKFSSVRPKKHLITQAVELAKWSAVEPAFRTWTYHVTVSPEAVAGASSLVDLNTVGLSHFLEQADAESTETAIQRYGMPASAPLFIMVTHHQKNSTKDERIVRSWFGMELQLLMLALYNSGIGACNILVPPWIASELLDTLDTDDDTLLALVAAGYPDERPLNPDRRSAPVIFY